MMELVTTKHQNPFAGTCIHGAEGAVLVEGRMRSGDCDACYPPERDEFGPWTPDVNSGSCARYVNEGTDRERVQGCGCPPGPCLKP